MLDPQRFTRGTRVRESQLAPVMVRRLKSDLRALGSDPVPRASCARRAPDACRRTVGRRVAPPRWQERGAPGGPGGGALRGAGALHPARPLHPAHVPWLEEGPARLHQPAEAAALQPRGLPPHAVRPRRGLRGGRPGAREPARRPSSRSPRNTAETEEALELAFEEDIRDASEGLSADRPGAAAARRDAAAERQAPHQPDAKLLALLEWIREHLCPLTRGAAWKPRRVIVFTEYGDTKRYLGAAHRRLRGHRPGRRAHPHHDRRARRCQARGDPGAPSTARSSEYPVRVLLATDAAREGINLQGHCADLFHFDVPWNPCAPGAAQWPHRSHAAARARRALSLLPLRSARRGRGARHPGAQGGHHCPRAGQPRQRADGADGGRPRRGHHRGHARARRAGRHLHPHRGDEAGTGVSAGAASRCARSWTPSERSASAAAR